MASSQPFDRHIPTLDQIPDALKQLNTWVVWVSFPVVSKKTGDVTWSKRPVVFNQDGKENFKWRNTPNFGRPLDEVLKDAHEQPNVKGIGIIIDYDATGISGGDLDDCVDKDGNLTDLAKSIVDEANTYTEISPSKTGLRFLFKGSFGGICANDGEKGIEFYEELRWLTFTGRRLEEYPFAIEERDLKDMAVKYFPDKFDANMNALPKGGSVSIEDFKNEDFVDVNLHALKIPKATIQLITEGTQAGGDRSKDMYAATIQLLKSGLSDKQVLSVMLNPENGISEKALEGRGLEAGANWFQKYTFSAAKKQIEKDREEALAEFTKVELAKPKDIPSKEGKKIDANYTNVMAVVSKLPIKFDAFLDTALIERNGVVDRFVDGDYVELCLQLERMGFKTPSMSLVKDVAKNVIRRNETDSAIDWAKGLVWDGVPRCETLFSNYFGVEDSEYTRAVSLYFTSAMAGRILHPGCQADMVPVLIGLQGVGKTSAVKALSPLPDAYAELDLSNSRDSDMSRQIRGKCICELGELKGLKGRESEWIKSYITRTHEEWTPKYQEFSTIMPRRCVFIGTTNESEFLSDRTGNRRWLPLKVQSPCKIDDLKADRDQIWAEAFEIFRKTGEVLWKDAHDLAREKHHDHMSVDEVMLDRVARSVAELEAEDKEKTGIIMLTKLCHKVFNYDFAAPRDQHRVKDALVYLGYANVRRYMDGKQARVWVKE